MRPLRLLPILFELLLATSPAALAHPPGQPLPPEEAAIARTVLTVRESIRPLVEAKDAKGLVQLFSDDFTHTHGSGKVDGRDNRVVALLSGEPTLELAPVDELQVRVYSPATVIVSGRSPLKSAADGRTYEFRWTQVFVKTGDRWQLAVSHATRLPPPAN
jgi:ketosteroid isomerase-like protein